MHDRCYEELEEYDCRIRTLSYKYQVTKGLVFCRKPAAPIRAWTSPASEFSCPQA